MARPICPCCGGTGYASEAVDALTDFQGRHLPRMQGRILGYLLQRRDKVVRHEELITAVWGGNEPDGAANTLKVQISNLRRRIDGSGWSVETIWGRGYVLRGPAAGLEEAAA